VRRPWLGILTAAVVLLGGCVAVQSEEVRQLDQVGDVEIRTVVCASRPTAVEGCPLGSSQRPAQSGDYQLLVGYRVPQAVRAPESIPSDPETGADLAIARDPSYTAELERLAPAGPDAKWIGYVSPPFAYQSVGGEYRAALLARFALTRGADGSPFGGTFRYRTVVGYRPADVDPARPVTCGEALHQPTPEGLCADWPAPEEIPADVTAPVRDVGLVAGPIVKARRGTTATVPFTFRHSGGDGAPSFTMTAATNAPGASATAQAPTFAPPTDSASPFLVTLSLPTKTPRGTYDVTLTATLANGQTRQATARLQVTRPGASGPALALAIPPRPRLADVLGSGLPVDAACSERCTLTAQLRIALRDARRAKLAAAARTVLVGSGRAKIARAGRGTVVLALTPRARKRLARLGRVHATVRVRAADRQGNHTTRSKRVTLR
jgi:hypothetical protein